MERRLQEQKERAMAMANFQQRSIKDEPQVTDSANEAFPAPMSTASASFEAPAGVDASG